MSTQTTLSSYLPLTGHITIATALGLAMIGDRFHAELEERKDRDGQRFTVLGMVEPSSYDFEEIGPLYRIQFPDGAQIDAWPEEVEAPVGR